MCPMENVKRFRYMPECTMPFPFADLLLKQTFNCAKSHVDDFKMATGLKTESIVTFDCKEKINVERVL